MKLTRRGGDAKKYFDAINTIYGIYNSHREKEVHRERIGL
jgi:hypothetical protein